MKIRIVGSSTEGEDEHQFLISYLVDDVVAVDAGSLGAMRLDAQYAVEQVCLTHSHLDHVATLPIFLENVYRPGPASVVVNGLDATLGALRSDLMNDRVWPDFVALSAKDNMFVRLNPIQPETPFTLAHLHVTAIELNHTVPTVGYLLQDGVSSVAIVSDTAPTERIWEYLRPVQNLSAVFLECSFPNDLAWLAVASGHLTPAQFRDEVDKLGRDVPFVAVHLKPAYRAKVAAELLSYGDPRIQIGRGASDYVF